MFTISKATRVAGKYRIVIDLDTPRDLALFHFLTQAADFASGVYSRIKTEVSVIDRAPDLKQSQKEARADRARLLAAFESSPGEKRDILSLLAQGKSVARVRMELGIARAERKAFLKERIRQLRGEKIPDREIARRLDLDPAQLRRIAGKSAQDRPGDVLSLPQALSMICLSIVPEIQFVEVFL